MKLMIANKPFHVPANSRGLEIPVKQLVRSCFHFRIVVVVVVAVVIVGAVVVLLMFLLLLLLFVFFCFCCCCCCFCFCVFFGLINLFFLPHTYILGKAALK